MIQKNPGKAGVFIARLLLFDISQTKALQLGTACMIFLAICFSFGIIKNLKLFYMKNITLTVLIKILDARRNKNSANPLVKRVCGVFRIALSGDVSFEYWLSERFTPGRNGRALAS